MSNIWEKNLYIMDNLKKEVITKYTLWILLWSWSDNSLENRLYGVEAQTSENMVLYKCWLSGISYKWK